MARVEDWDEANWKWIKLAEDLRDAGWKQHDPRRIKRQMHAGRAVFHETEEAVSAHRTIYAFAVKWKNASPEDQIQLWIHADFQSKISEGALRDELEKRFHSR